MAFENAGSIVRDLREALQDVVAPDLKAVVRGLSDLKESVASLRTEMKESNALLREEMQSSNALLREEMQSSNALLREEIGRVEVRTAKRIEESEERTRERIDRVYDAVKIADLTRRNEELLRENQQLRSPQPEQQH